MLSVILSSSDGHAIVEEATLRDVWIAHHRREHERLRQEAEKEERSEERESLLQQARRHQTALDRLTERTTP